MDVLATRIPLTGGSEYDAFAWNRSIHQWGRGECKATKRRYNRRFRKAVRRALKEPEGR